MSVRETIIAKLTEQLSPTHLEVLDESERHRGHGGWREGGETHFRVRIATRYFVGKPRVAQHRAIMGALKDELDGPVHALAIDVLPLDGPLETPDGVSVKGI